MKRIKAFSFLTLFIILVSLFTLHAQSAPEELGEKLFNLFKNESNDFSSTLPTMEQLSDQVRVITVVPFQSRLKSFSEEYPVSLKRFNEKCTGILEKGKAAGIKWKRIKLESVIPYPQNIDIKFADQMATVKFTKLCINFSFRRREFIFIADAVMEFNGQYLICDDLIEFSEIATNTWYRP